MRPAAFQDLIRKLEFFENFIEVPGFNAAARRFGISMHRVTTPNHDPAIGFHCFNDCPKPFLDFVCAHSMNEREMAGFIARIQGLCQTQRFIRSDGRPNLYRDGVRNAAKVLNMRAVQSSRPLANPGKMG